MERRNFLSLLAAGSLTFPTVVKAVPLDQFAGDKRQSYQQFLASIKAVALSHNISSSILDQAFAGLAVPNLQVMQREQHQPEFTLTWNQYQKRVLGPERFQKGLKKYNQVQSVLDPIAARYQCDSSVIMGIWGLESSFGVTQGKFNVIDALATLAYLSRRKRFFCSELLNALTILDRGDITFEMMSGSYAGAMGQPQFMPSAYLHYAADGDGDGKCDIWNSQPDVFASIANYISKSGWQYGQPWGEEVVVPLGENGSFVSLGAQKYKQAITRSVSEWSKLGIKRVDGSDLDVTRPDAKLIQPDGAGTEAFLVYPNYKAIRAYNPSDFYALSVGILGQRSTELRSL